jgi:hypothetical protein
MPVELGVPAKPRTRSASSRQPNGVRRTGRSPDRWEGPELLLGVCTAAGLIGAGIGLWTLPAALILPAVSTVAVAAAAVIGLATARAAPGLRSPRLTYRDLAGGLALIGIAAALLSDPEQVLPLIEARSTNR